MRQRVVSAFLLLFGSVFLSTVFVSHADDRPKSIKPVDDSKSKSTPSPNEAAVKQVTDALLKAYQNENAEEFASAFTADGEYVDVKGTVFHGRKAIEDEFKSFFREIPDSTMEIEFNAVRPIAGGVIVSECTTRFKRSKSTPSIPGRCQLVCTRDGDAWRIASLRETDAPVDGSSHHAQVSQLEWFIGDWIGEGARSHLHLTCRWDESGRYLLRDFSWESGAGKPLTGTQRIGYDPITQHLKMWAFDSSGGYSDGYFHRDGETWILRTSGVTPGGQVASMTNSFKVVDDHRIISEVVDHFVGGERINDNEKITLVRKAPRSVDRSSQDVDKSDANASRPSKNTDRQ